MLFTYLDGRICSYRHIGNGLECNIYRRVIPYPTTYESLLKPIYDGNAWCKSRISLLFPNYSLQIERQFKKREMNFHHGPLQALVQLTNTHARTCTIAHMYCTTVHFIT